VTPRFSWLKLGAFSVKPAAMREKDSMGEKLPLCAQ
jgi:hypothetical protein